MATITRVSSMAPMWVQGPKGAGWEEEKLGHEQESKLDVRTKGGELTCYAPRWPKVASFLYRFLEILTLDLIFIIDNVITVRF